MIELKGKNALITGSSRGVGQQIALGLAQLGCHVIVHGRKEENNKETLELLKAYSVNTYSVYGDLSDENQISDLIDQVRTLQIPIDILYNNAGIMRDYREDIWSHTTEDWLETYKVNVVAMYKLCSAFVPLMIENNFGRVVNTTSRIMDQPQLAPYGASKWAVDKLSQDIAAAVKNTPVRINYMDPSWLRTDLGGEHADNPVEAVLPGALAPLLIDDDGPNGQFFSAIEN
ncbi:SDR family oxidoreductase [Nonlabens sp. Ci31]|jgi:NAD(P)-dependent dehydrogenase (short-subunit alcohol dehydrogenase family)|uniref:SDR family NAD(P)-dependent oxidoreductase n=1 Tax=Nonlabens sp. Ci31 TaxID=2608253 RepID=UPI00146452FD|nr:SDR family oxidoreductase [Nonlabens sp. Ci31]QJP35492.1 SDR family oxidoreductase [Nonlabens sp. Ci31]